MIACVAWLALAPNAFVGEFGPVQRIAPISRSVAVSFSRKQPWLAGRLSDVRRLVRTAPEKPQQSIELAVQLPEGWIYVDSEGVVSGALTGRFNVLGWRNLVISARGPAESVRTDTIIVKNKTFSPFTLVNGSIGRGSKVKPKSMLKLNAWYGEYSLMYGTKEIVEISRLRRLQIFTSGTKFKVTSRYDEPQFKVKAGKVVAARQGHLVLEVK